VSRIPTVCHRLGAMNDGWPSRAILWRRKYRWC
jgi:hypothetical protein